MSSIHMTVEMMRAVQKARDEIMAQEDARILEILESIAPNCNDPSHPGYGKAISFCEHPDCIARSIHDA